MLQVQTTIHQAGEHMQTCMKTEPTIISRDDRQLRLTYVEEETQMTVTVTIEKTLSHPIIHLRREGEYVSEMDFMMGRKTRGEYILSPSQQIVFDIHTATLTVADDWSSIEWAYQLIQQGENLGDFVVRVDFIEEN